MKPDLQQIADWLDDILRTTPSVDPLDSDFEYIAVPSGTKPKVFSMGVQSFDDDPLGGMSTFFNVRDKIPHQKENPLAETFWKYRPFSERERAFMKDKEWVKWNGGWKKLLPGLLAEKILVHKKSSWSDDLKDYAQSYAPYTPSSYPSEIELEVPESAEMQFQRQLSTLLGEKFPLPKTKYKPVNYFLHNKPGTLEYLSPKVLANTTRPPWPRRLAAKMPKGSLSNILKVGKPVGLSAIALLALLTALKGRQGSQQQA